jgi:hypothetical protein
MINVEPELLLIHRPGSAADVNVSYYIDLPV